jgi:uncharacterized membrane protein YtjA (UPF0391 family)
MIREAPRFALERARLGWDVNKRNAGRFEAPMRRQNAGGIMLSWTITLLVIALIAALLGFTGIAGAAAGIAKILFAVFLILFVISLFFGRRTSV